VNPSVPIGVHSIRFANRKNNKYATIYLHHGFGASSLSWPPVLPTLVDRLGARVVGIAHDAPGFGFTDRPDADSVGGLKQYRTENSVGIGMALLDKTTTGGSYNVEITAKPAEDDATVKNVAIFGHSMGAKAALLMAFACSWDTVFG
jgi:pimeloyl-ACP methyl ester carboxylesterase